jgi:hypothetical protein
MGAPPALGVHQREHVLGHELDGEGLTERLAGAEAAVVEAEAAEVGREGGLCRQAGREQV